MVEVGFAGLFLVYEGFLKLDDKEEEVVEVVCNNTHHHLWNIADYLLHMFSWKFLVDSPMKMVRFLVNEPYCYSY